MIICIRDKETEAQNKLLIPDHPVKYWQNWIQTQIYLTHDGMRKNNFKMKNSTNFLDKHT